MEYHITYIIHGVPRDRFLGTTYYFSSNFLDCDSSASKNIDAMGVRVVSSSLPKVRYVNVSSGGVP